MMKILLPLLFALSFVGCGSGNMPIVETGKTLGDKPKEVPDDPVIPLTPTFQGIMANILQPKCLECHSKATSKNHGVILNSYAEIMNATHELVTPGEPMDSDLYAAVFGGKMPPNKEKLTAEEIDAIRVWILEGAKNN